MVVGPDQGRSILASQDYVTIAISGIPAGPKGDQGIQGNTGTQGVQGPIGPQGIQGNTGTVGIQGPVGNTGTQGVQGPIGDTGAQGISIVLVGSSATTTVESLGAGSAGQGWINTTDGDVYFWNTLTTLWENIGPIVGPQGERGLQGTQGEKGDQGIPGAKGDTGAQGSTGTQGVAGPTGPKGDQGIQGNTGTQGLLGPTGPKGDRGETGLTGEPGATGPRGTTGTAATVTIGTVTVSTSTASVTNVGTTSSAIFNFVLQQGPQGIQGPIGNTGTQGSVGPAGSNGFTTTSTLVNGTSTVSLSSTGELTLPGGVGLRSVGVTGADGRQSLASTSTDGNLFLTANSATTGSVFLLGQQNYIISGSDISDGATYKQWVFGQDGSLSFPDNTVQTTAYPGVLVPANGDNVSGVANLVFYDGTWNNTSKVGINPATGFLTIAGTGGEGGIILPNAATITNPADVVVSTGLRLEITGSVYDPNTGGIELQLEDPAIGALISANPSFYSFRFASGAALGVTLPGLFVAVDTPAPGSTWRSQGWGLNTPNISSNFDLFSSDYVDPYNVPGYLKLSSDTNVDWAFGKDGKLKLPAGGDIVDSNGTSVLGGGSGGGLSITDFGIGFVNTLDAGKITTSKLYNKNPNPGLNNQYTLEITDGGVVVLPDQSIINGATLKTVAGNYAGITAGPQGSDEDSWVWVDNDGATIATKYSTDNHQWKFGNDGVLTLPTNGTISYTPDDTDNWNNPAVNTIQAALDELAAKVAALQNFEIDGGNANTPAAGELLIDGNGV